MCCVMQGSAAGSGDVLNRDAGGRLRAARRLAGTVVITGWCVLRLVRDCFLSGWNGPLVARHAGDWARMLCRHLRVDIHVRGRIPDNGVMIVSNHRSYIDIVVILSQIDAAFLAKKELRSWPLFGYAAARGNTVFVDRRDKQSRRESRKAILDRLQQGVCVVVFPEGTTFEGPGILEFKKGIFHMAAGQGISTVPVSVFYENREAAWVGEDTFVPHFLSVFKTLRMQAHLAIGPELSGCFPDELRDKCRAFIQKDLDDREAGLQEKEGCSAVQAGLMPNCRSFFQSGGVRPLNRSQAE